MGLLSLLEGLIGVVEGILGKLLLSNPEADATQIASLSSRVGAMEATLGEPRT
jgi:hypothetical protein